MPMLIVVLEMPMVRVNGMHQMIQKIMVKTHLIYHLMRETPHKKRCPLMNLTTAIKSIVAPIQDYLKTSKKENFIGNERQR